MDDPKITREEIWLKYEITIVEVPKLINKAKPDFPKVPPLIFSVKEDKNIQACMHYLDHIERELKGILINLSEEEAHLLLNHLKYLQVGIALGQIDSNAADERTKLYNEIVSKLSNKNKREL